MTIAGRIVAARNRLGWTREALAYRSGVSWSAISQIEGGRRTNPRPETLVALAGALGVTVGYLVGERPQALLTHRVLLYDSDDAFGDAVVPFIDEGVERAEPVLVVTSGPNLALLRDRIGTIDGDVTFAESADWYVSPLSAVTAYRAFVTDRIDADAPWIRVVGEPLWPRHSSRGVSSWATYEAMFNLLFATFPVTAVCPYHIGDCDPPVIDIARQTHPFVLEGTSVQANDRYVDPEEFVLTRPAQDR